MGDGMNYFEKYLLYKITPYKWDNSLSSFENQREALDKSRVRYFDFMVVLIGLIYILLKYKKDFIYGVR